MFLFVNVKVGFLVAPKITIWTFKWFFSSVNEEMTFQIAWVSKVTVTNGTDVLAMAFVRFFVQRISLACWLVSKIRIIILQGHKFRASAFVYWLFSFAENNLANFRAKGFFNQESRALYFCASLGWFFDWMHNHNQDI